MLTDVSVDLLYADTRSSGFIRGNVDNGAHDVIAKAGKMVRQPNRVVLF
ncbi:hypothetical protein [Mycobacteroides abscessus]|nr:hypothetical protein [Mycobacteroides abscessus]